VKQDTVLLASESDLSAFGAEWASQLAAGDLVLLSGPLGAGKTTLVRAILGALGWREPVRSPTFNLIHTYPTHPPVMHADLYRLKSAADTGLEEFLESHLCFFEWPDRLDGAFDGLLRWEVGIEVSGPGRKLSRRRIDPA
jgi:tRNA threonylcarbamoyladenosine biosynthesis protein TsaE